MPTTEGYNGAYTGAQIDAVIGTVRQKEATWDIKPVMYVTVIGTDLDGYTADKTFAEIQAAYDAGYALFLTYSDMVFPLLQVIPSLFVFGTTVGTTGYQLYFDDSNNIAAQVIEITPDTIDAVPTTRTINNHALSADITLTSDDVGALALPSEVVSDCNDWLTSGYAKTSTSTVNLPAACTGNDMWGVLFFIAENATNGTGTQMYFPIDGDNKGRIFSRSLTNVLHDGGAYAVFGEWTKLLVDGDVPSLILRTATLTTSGWSSNSQTIAVTGVVADTSAQVIDVAPASKTDAENWASAGIWCTAQGANSLTFTCNTVPTAAITVNVKIQEVAR